MASIRKRRSNGEDKYDVRWRDPDGVERTRTCPTRGVAEQLRRDVETARALGRRWEPGHASAAPTLNEAADLYLAWRLSRKRGATVRVDDVALDRFIRWAAARRCRGVDSLTADSLQEWDLSLRSESPPLSTRSANGYVGRVRRWMAWLAAQPSCRDFVRTPPEMAALDLPTVPWRAPIAPRWGEMDAAIDHAPREWVGDAMWVMRCTGLRETQAMRIRWEDFHADGRDGDMLHVRPELGKTRQERAGRLVPVTPHLLERFAGRGVRTGWLVGPHKADRSIGTELADRAWLDAEVDERVWRGHPNHAFRYGFESGLVSEGADWLAVEHLVGHAVKGAGSSYLDPTWALRLREAVGLVPAFGKVVEFNGRESGEGG
jgi:integrase